MKISTLALGTLAIPLVASSAVFADNHTGNTESNTRFGERLQRSRHFLNNNDVAKTYEVIENGVKLTLTSSDPEIVIKLQSREPKPRDGSTVTKTDITNGVIITKTSSDDQKVKKWQKRVKHKNLKESITKTVSNLDNGVQITLTSNNSEAITKLHEKADKMAERESRRESVSNSVTKLSNGIVIMMTSTNEKTVEKIQNRAERGKYHGMKKRFGKNGGKRRGVRHQDQ